MQFNPNEYQPFKALPNEILNHTLSFLPPTEELATTSRVARRWYNFSHLNAKRKIQGIWKTKMEIIDAIPNKKHRPLKLIYSNLIDWSDEELHRMLGEKVQQFVINHGQPPSNEFESYVDLNSPYWSFFLRGHLERLRAEHESIVGHKTLTLNIKENNWDAIDKIINTFPTQTDKLILELTSNTAPPHASPSKLPLQLFKQSKSLQEMGVTVSKRLAFSAENFEQISQLIFEKHNDPKSKNIRTLRLTFNHLDVDPLFDFIRTFEPLDQKLTIIFKQVFGRLESCSALHCHTMGLEYLRREVNPKLTLEYLNKIEL